MELQNFIRGRPSQDHQPRICSTKIPSLAGRAKLMNLAKWSSQISSAAGPVKTTNLAICSTKILSQAGQNHEPYKMEFQNFIRGRPVKTTNLEICSDFLIFVYVLSNIFLPGQTCMWKNREVRKSLTCSQTLMKTKRLVLQIQK